MVARAKYIEKPEVADQFKVINTKLPGSDINWMQQWRKQAMEAFSNTGIPTQAQEEWKFTNLKDLQRKNFTSPLSDIEEHFITKDLSLLDQLPQGPRLVFIDGIYQEKYSDAVTGKIMVYPLKEALEKAGDRVKQLLDQTAQEDAETHPFVDLDAALMTDGFYVHAPKNVVADQPIVVLYLNTQAKAQSHLRVLLDVEEGADITLIEVHKSLEVSASFTNLVTNTKVGANARLRQIKINHNTADDYHIAMTQAVIEKDSRLESFNLNTGARISRHEAHILIQGENSECHWNSALLLRDQRHADFTARVTHNACHCLSKQMCKTIVDDQAKAVFQGKTIVRPGAQNTDGYQLNNNLLLSPKATVDTKPELEIFADDVKCSHGATTGQLDKDALFYLCSRGLSEQEARQLLIKAFIADEIEAVTYDEIKPHLNELVQEWFDHDDNSAI